jgi:hypothetical protein
MALGRRGDSPPGRAGEGAGGEGAGGGRMRERSIIENPCSDDVDCLCSQARLDNNRVACLPPRAPQEGPIVHFLIAVNLQVHPRHGQGGV